uniref:Transmembrane protein 138 n=1 Tax=Panagrolaimus sp. PS1159 TaxID=55785 RepID=A0AC35FQG3_9BILA
MLFILQDTAIVLSIIILLITFSSTFVFQAGLISILVKRFSQSIIVSTIYLFLSITLHVTSLRDRWGTTERYIWPISITVLYVIQRISK